MLGDNNCHSCGHDPCSCNSEPQPCVPCSDGECEIWVPAKCVFWTGDPIPGTPIKKGTRLTEVITHLIARIVALETP